MNIAKNINGELIVIAEAIEVQEYNCIDCGAKVFAKNKKKEDRKKIIHFAHYGLCTGNLETYLHKIAKIIIANESHILLPKLGRFAIYQTKTEVALQGIIPDILIIDKNQREVAIEIFVTHKTEVDKMAKIKTIGISAFEINLSKLNYDSNLESIRYEVIDNIYNRTDLNPAETKDSGDNKFILLLLAAVALLAYIFWPKKRLRYR